MHERGLVQGHAGADVAGHLGVLHELDGREEDARAVVADHGLAEAVGRVRARGRADLEAGDAHDVGVEGLGVLGAQRLVRRRAAGADDGHGHLELAARRRVRVARRRELGHAVDAKIGVHELDDGPVAVHALAEGLAEEVALVDDLVGRAERAEGLLRELGDVVARARLEVLRVDRRHGVAHHLLEDGEVERVADVDAVALGRVLEHLDARLAVGQIPRGHGPRRDRRAVDGRGLGVVVRVRLVGVLELLGELARRRRRRLGEGDRVLDDLRGLGLAVREHVLGQDA
mmetsp:Transcript_23028/g.76417  ORF Transcript_23028/g.76417 Transcript_23028/m.76417 type:complete len:287 (+) Transcript_23028:538-1398(+)